MRFSHCGHRNHDRFHASHKEQLAREKINALLLEAAGWVLQNTACTFSWRLLKHAKAHRILFLVDRNNLGDQTLKEYQNYDPPGSGCKFDKTYIVQHLHSNRIDPDAKVVITTIQRLYAMLRGEVLDESAEKGSAFETWTNEEGELGPAFYNPEIPSDKMLTDIISLVRFSTGQAEVLEPYSARVEQRFNLWIGRQFKPGRTFNEDHMNWLKAIKDYLAANVEIAPADLMQGHPFSEWGGVIAARKVFGVKLDEILDELSEALAA